MFILALLEDSVRIPPERFNKELHSISDEINKKYSNRVLLDVGLCICLYDIVKLGDAFVFPGDGASFVQTKFRMIVFKPFVGEVLVGRILNSSEDGVHVSMAFFEHIFIPFTSLQQPSTFHRAEKKWLWEYSGYQLSMDQNMSIRFRVDAVEFNSPSHPRKINEANLENDAPMIIIGSIAESGLGMLSWWSPNTEEDTKTETKENQ
eukprot:TRINITY_DN9543_c1_g1_i1.p1 TRINITY_DN9543_c1_g1~~TRINITY_DN9543_c1_g1_i1.p1  ORF type:complete len:206 (-),score=30.50 TRINITY_DN9543_c1_g1_i1:21-638(-)